MGLSWVEVRSNVRGRVLWGVFWPYEEDKEASQCRTIVRGRLQNLHHVTPYCCLQFALCLYVRYGSNLSNSDFIDNIMATFSLPTPKNIPCSFQLQFGCVYIPFNTNQLWHCVIFFPARKSPLMHHSSLLPKHAKMPVSPCFMSFFLIF